MRGCLIAALLLLPPVSAARAQDRTVPADSTRPTITAAAGTRSHRLTRPREPLLLDARPASAPGATAFQPRLHAPARRPRLCYTPGIPGTPDILIPGTPATPDVIIPGAPGLPDIVILGTPGTPPTVIPGAPGTAGTWQPCDP